MSSLYAKAWKTFIHSLVKLFWTFVLYLRSLSFRAGEYFPTTPKPRGEKLERSVVDLEGGGSPCDPKLDGRFLSFDMLRSISDVLFSASPTTPLTPTPCFRRARASTLSAYTPPNTDSTPRRPPVTSRSSGSSLSSTVRSGDSCMSGDPVVCGAYTDSEDRPLSEGSLCSFTTALCADSQESIPVGITIGNTRRSIVVESEETMSTPENKSLTNCIANHRDSRYVNAYRIKGALLKEHIPIPFKCLSPMKTLSIRVVTSGGSYARTTHRRVSTITVVSELLPSRTKSSVYISKRPCSVDLGLLQKQRLPLGAAKSEAQTRVFTGHPWSATSPIREHRSHTKGTPFDGHITAALLLARQDKSSVNTIRNTTQDSHLLTGKSGFGTERALCDVSLVKRVFSVMRANDGEQDARNIFDRESVWDFRKSTTPSVKPLFLGGIKLGGNDIFGAPIRKSRLGTAKASSVAFRGPGRTEQLPKIMPNKRALKSRHRSAMYGPSPSPSIQCQLRKEKIRRQRKLRQEMMSSETKKSCSQSEKARESYDWRAED